MATIVTGDQYREIDGKLFEIKRQLRQKEGYPFSPVYLDRALQAIVEGCFEAVDDRFPSEIFAAKLIPENWEVLEDIAPTLKSIADLELVPFLNQNESFIAGTVMRSRAITLKANLGLVDAKYLLDHQLEIPAEFRSNVLVFAGTLLRGSNGDLHVAYLCWNGNRWCLRFYRVGCDWDDGDRLVRCKPACQ